MQSEIGSEGWLRERFPDKEWHRHPRSDGGTDLCDGTPSDCASKRRVRHHGFGVSHVGGLCRVCGRRWDEAIHAPNPGAEGER